MGFAHYSPQVKSSVAACWSPAQIKPNEPLLSLLKAQLTTLLYREGERLGKGKLGAWWASPQFSSRFLPAIPSIVFTIAKNESHKGSKSGKSKPSGSLYMLSCQIPRASDNRGLPFPTPNVFFLVYLVFCEHACPVWSPIL